MNGFQVNLYFFFAALEIALILVAASSLLWLRGRRLAGRVRALQDSLKNSSADEAVTYAQYLRDEIIRNQGLIDAAQAADTKAEKAIAEQLQLRKRFLELELDANGIQGNPVQFQHKLGAGLAALIEEYRPQPETLTETVAEPAEEVAQAADTEESAEPAEEVRKTIDTHDAEIDRLREVINNQQDAMQALREELAAHEGELEDLHKITDILDNYEKQAGELESCIRTLEQENERLKASKSGGGVAEPAEEAGLGNLKNMVDGQQSTINSLRKLISDLVPEAGKAQQLEESLNRLQRTNQELNGCVSVLEDENAMLRAELEQIKVQLEDSEQEAEVAPVEAEAKSEQDKEGARELKIKIQELEALVEFKDAAIEELEKQYNALEAKYLEATGQKKVE